MNWWIDFISPPAGKRSKKVRTQGITMVMDKGIGLSAVNDLIASAGEYIDIVKLTAGTAPLSNLQFIRQKISRLKEASVDVMLGGTLTEIAIHQRVFRKFLELAKTLGCAVLEIADGSIYLPLNERRDAVKRALDMGFRVITEVGKEDPSEAMDLNETLEAIAWDYESGAHLINIEAREFGNVGIYDEEGKVREELLSEILKAVPNPTRILWEAPIFSQQLDLVRRLGQEVNLGNIQPTDVLRLETIRQGLIGDTFRDCLSNEKVK